MFTVSIVNIFVNLINFVKILLICNIKLNLTSLSKSKKDGLFPPYSPIISELFK